MLAVTATTVGLPGARVRSRGGGGAGGVGAPGAVLETEGKAGAIELVSRRALKEDLANWTLLALVVASDVR